MQNPLGLGIIGCGDFLRLNESALKASSRVAVKRLFDLNPAASAKWASMIGAPSAHRLDEIYDDPEIGLVLVFTPPWVRREHVERACAGGKHILTTKPLAAHEADCLAMIDAVKKARTQCGVMYRRTGDRDVEALRGVLASGEIGRLAIYRMDWIHHFPQWNQWALDPSKNGGPFMDAMIHNLNIARCLMGRKAQRGIFFGDRLAHELPCNDTESLRLEFEGGGIADLFITWAADLEAARTDGNFREHHETFMMVTDKGFRLTREKDAGGKAVWAASKEGKKRFFPIEPIPGGTVFDRFALAAESGGPLPTDLADVDEAAEDIRIIRGASERSGVMVEL